MKIVLTNVRDKTWNNLGGNCILEREISIYKKINNRIVQIIYRNLVDEINDSIWAMHLEELNLL